MARNLGRKYSKKDMVVRNKVEAGIWSTLLNWYPLRAVPTLFKKRQCPRVERKGPIEWQKKRQYTAVVEKTVDNDADEGFVWFGLFSQKKKRPPGHTPTTRGWRQSTRRREWPAADRWMTEIPPDGRKMGLKSRGASEKTDNKILNRLKNIQF